MLAARSSPPEIIERMRKIAHRLSVRGYPLQSGGADGADKAFASDATSAEIFLPWPGFNHQPAGPSVHHDVSEEAIAVAAVHPAFSKLSDPVKKLMARNSYQVLGHDL